MHAHTCTLAPWGILQTLLKFAGSGILVFQNKWPEMTFWGSSLCIWQQLLSSQDLMNTRKLMGRARKRSISVAGGMYVPLRESSFLLFFFPSLPSSLHHSSSSSYSHLLESQGAPEQRGTGHLVRSPGKESGGAGTQYFPASTDQGQEQPVSLLLWTQRPFFPKEGSSRSGPS